MRFALSADSMSSGCVCWKNPSSFSASSRPRSASFLPACRSWISSSILRESKVTRTSPSATCVPSSTAETTWKADHATGARLTSATSVASKTPLAETCTWNGPGEISIVFALDLAVESPASSAFGGSCAPAPHGAITSASRQSTPITPIVGRDIVPSSFVDGVGSSGPGRRAGASRRSGRAAL